MRRAKSLGRRRGLVLTGGGLAGFSCCPSNIVSPLSCGETATALQDAAACSTSEFVRWRCRVSPCGSASKYGPEIHPSGSLLVWIMKVFGEARLPTDI